jgi:hypothetical protein
LGKMGEWRKIRRVR